MTRQEAASIARAARMAKQPTLHDRFWSKVKIRSDNDCWEWQAAVRRKDEGYGAFWLNKRHQPASKVAWLLTYGDIGPEQQILHKCDNPKCCNPNHLFVGTHQDNNKDKVNKKRHAYGSKIGTSKLSEEQVIIIKQMHPGEKAKRGAKDAVRYELAQRFNVSPATISDVWTRRWRHVEVR